MKLESKLVYIPTTFDDDYGLVLQTYNGSNERYVKKVKQAFVFTKEDLINLIEDYTNKIIENVKMYDANDLDNPELDENGNAYECYIIDKNSIRNQLELFKSNLR